MGACLKAITELVYKIPYRRARAWPSGRVRRASKGILHTITELNVPQMYPEISIIGLLFFTKAIIFHKTVILVNFKLFSEKNSHFP